MPLPVRALDARIQHSALGGCSACSFYSRQALHKPIGGHHVPRRTRAEIQHSEHTLYMADAVASLFLLRPTSGPARTLLLRPVVTPCTSTQWSVYPPLALYEIRSCQTTATQSVKSNARLPSPQPYPLGPLSCRSPPRHTPHAPKPLARVQPVSIIRELPRCTATAIAPSNCRSILALVHAPEVHFSPSSPMARTNSTASLASPPHVSSATLSSSAPMREAMCAYFFVFSACLEAVLTRLLTRAILSPCVTTTSLSINRLGRRSAFITNGADKLLQL